MLSARLWRQIAQPDTDNPIFRRASHNYQPARAPKRRVSLPRPLLLCAGIAAIAAVALQPQLLVLLFALPMLMVMLVVASPALLPFFALLASLFLVVEVIQGIYREKRQHTYDLICSASPGSFGASWAVARGIAHRGGWLLALRWGSVQALRLGGGGLVGVLLLMLWQLLTEPSRLGLEQLRALLLFALFLALYYTHLTQTVCLGALIGLFASSFELDQRDAAAIGACLYIVAQALSLGLALLAYAAGAALLVEPGALARMALELLTAGIVILCREALVLALWRWLLARLGGWGWAVNLWAAIAICGDAETAV